MGDPSKLRAEAAFLLEGEACTGGALPRLGVVLRGVEMGEGVEAASVASPSATILESGFAQRLNDTFPFPFSFSTLLIRSRISLGGFAPILSARSHRARRDRPAHGPYLEVSKSNFRSAISSDDKCSHPLGTVLSIEEVETAFFGERAGGEALRFDGD